MPPSRPERGERKLYNAASTEALSRVYAAAYSASLARQAAPSIAQAAAQEAVRHFCRLVEEPLDAS